MVFISKSSFLVLRSMFLQTIFSQNSWFMFFDFFNPSFFNVSSVSAVFKDYQVSCCFLSSKFISFFYKFFNLRYLLFLKPGVFLVFGSGIEKFLNIYNNSSLDFFLVGACFDFCFLNSFFFFNLEFLFLPSSFLLSFFVSFFFLIFLLFFFNFFTFFF